MKLCIQCVWGTRLSSLKFECLFQITGLVTEGTSWERPLITRQEHSASPNATIHSSLGNETAFHLANRLFMWLFCQHESGGKLYQLSFLALISISLSKLVILVLTPQAHRQAWGRTATTVGNGQNTVSFLFSFPNSHTIVIKYAENFYRPSFHLPLWFGNTYSRKSVPWYTVHTTRNNTRCIRTYFLPKQPSENFCLKDSNVINVYFL